jgi:hypothetical protein
MLQCTKVSKVVMRSHRQSLELSRISLVSPNGCDSYRHQKFDIPAKQTKAENSACDSTMHRKERLGNDLDASTLYLGLKVLDSQEAWK